MQLKTFLCGAISRLGGMLAVTLLVASCGSVGDGSSPNTSGSSPPPNACGSDCGKVIVAVTDADGDFLSYTVDVVSLKLTRANGTVVETLPATTRIDFAQYVDLTEFLTSATVPNGSYLSATLRLDYTNSEITVEQNGAPVPAKPVDASGTALGVVDVTVTLDNRHQLVVSPGRPSLFTLDFNLAATNTVDLTTSPAMVTVTPALVASLEPVAQKDLRVRGDLVSVDTSASSYIVDVRPFHHMHKDNFGQATVHTDADTTFEIDGTSYTGSAGLDALNAAGAGIATVALGTLTTADRTFTAKQVFAGTSVPGEGIDTVSGEVLARSGDELTVRGGNLCNRDGEHFARGSIKVLLGPDTKVVKGGTAPATELDKTAISVGQYIVAFGKATQPTPPAQASVDHSAQDDEESGDWTLDATAGRVRMEPTAISGFVKSTSEGGVTLQLASIGHRRVSAFDFAGTGMTAEQDADPMNYEVTTGALDLSGLHEGEPTRLIGFPTPFGAAPPDFTARTLVDYQKLGASLSVTWGWDGTTAPFSSQDATALVLNLDNAEIGRLHLLRVGPSFQNLSDLPASPRIVPPMDGNTAYLIVKRDGSKSFTSFGDFVTELGTELDGTTKMLAFNAEGSYDADTNVFTTPSIVVILK